MRRRAAASQLIPSLQCNPRCVLLDSIKFSVNVLYDLNGVLGHHRNSKSVYCDMAGHSTVLYCCILSGYSGVDRLFYNHKQQMMYFLLGMTLNQLYHRYNTALSGKITPIMELSPKGSFSTRNTVNISLASTNSSHNGYFTAEKQFCNSYPLHNMRLLHHYC